MKKFEKKFTIRDKDTQQTIKIFFPDRVEVFSDKNQLQRLTYIVTITEALNIVKCGYNPNVTYTGLSMINRNRHHELHKLPLLPFQPFQPFMAYSDEGNVAFSTEDIGEKLDLSKFNIYYVDFVERRFKATIVNLLLTTKSYENLLPVNLNDSKSVLFIKDNVFYYNTEWNSNHISIRFLTNPKDLMFPNNVSYVIVNRHEEQITIEENDSINKFTPHVFTDKLLGFLFYCLLKYESSINQEKFNFVNDTKYHFDLCRILEPLNVLALDNFKGVFTYAIRRADDVMRKLIIPRSFSFGINTDWEDCKTMDILKKMFLDNQQCRPSPSGCIRHILKILCGYIKDKISFERCDDVLGVINVFLNNFLDETERKLVGKSIYVFVSDMWK